MLIFLSSIESGDSILVGSGLTEKTFAFALRPTREGSQHLLVLQLLSWMCREYARCLKTLKQAAVEHKCASIGLKEIKESHTELMVMQLDREFFLLLFFSFSFFFPFFLAIPMLNYMRADFRLNSTTVYMKALVHGDVRI